MAEKKRTRSTPRPTKDRVLQARIPEHLDDELRGRAAQLGLSVSTIVRNALLHTFELVEGVVTDSAQVGRVLRGGKLPTASDRAISPSSVPDDDSAVVGWQEAVLNRNGVCDTCNTILPIGQRAAVGVPLRARPVLLCLQCLAALSTQHHGPVSDQAPAKKTRPRALKSP